MTIESWQKVGVILRIVVAIALIVFAIGTLGFNAFGLGAAAALIYVVFFIAPARWYHKW